MQCMVMFDSHVKNSSWNAYFRTILERVASKNGAISWIRVGTTRKRIGTHRVGKWIAAKGEGQG